MRTVFISWQKDTPDNIGRSFLKDILHDVCKEIASDDTLDKSLRDLNVDSDTQGAAGKAAITETILEKIDQCTVFVADMTLVGRLKDDEGVPNPNVLIEYGRAVKAVGNKRVICVMNTAYGEPKDYDIPFNLRHIRWPIRYKLAEGASPEVKKQERQNLARELNMAIRTSLATLPPPAVDAPLIFQETTTKDGPARFRRPGDSLGFEDNGYSSREVSLSSGPAMWLRLMPIGDPGREWSRSELKERAATPRPLLMPLVSNYLGCSYLRAEDGIGLFGMSQKDSAVRSKSVRTDSASFAFKTGEIWTIDTSLLREKSDRLPFAEHYFVQAITNYGFFLQSLGLNGPYRWIAGIVGAKGRAFSLERYPRYGSENPCASDLIEDEGQYTGGQDPTQSLLPFFTKIFDSCGLERV
jgi:hypothetical protein